MHRNTPRKCIDDKKNCNKRNNKKNPIIFIFFISMKDDAIELLCIILAFLWFCIWLLRYLTEQGISRHGPIGGKPTAIS